MQMLCTFLPFDYLQKLLFNGAFNSSDYMSNDMLTSG
jgi:hypothetical protein